MQDLNEIKGFICDMDGVIYHGEQILPGVADFVDWLQKNNKEFLFLTNASSRSPKELHLRLARMGLDVDESHFYTSAQATAQFLNSQAPGCSAYVVGDPGLYNALYEVGITINDVNPDYVVIGETVNYNFDTIKKAMRHVMSGARLIGTNTDLTGPSETGILPACRALVAPIEITTGKSAYFVGKPNPLMMRTGLKMLGVHSGEACMIGDRMDTDVIAGIETGMTSVLVLSGVTTRDMIRKYPYRPTMVLSGVGEIPKLAGCRKVDKANHPDLG